MSAVSREGSDPERPGPRKPTIVVIDDDDLVLTSTAEVLEHAGYRVLTRNRPSGCVAMILQEKPDLVLLDVCMPTVSGDTLVKLFGRASPHSKTIILLYSALDEPLLRSKAKGSGAHGYVMKASGPSVLLRTLKQWLRSTLGDTRLPGAIKAAALSSKAPLPQHSSTRRRVDPMLVANHPVDIRPMAPEAPRRTSGSYLIEQPTVLLVDDEMLVLSGYRRQLQGQPFQFEFALSGAQALRVLTSAAPPSVVVSDLLMPDPDGVEVLRRALDYDESWARRFVIVTAQPLHDARNQLDPRFRGAVLRKPIDTEALSSAIHASLSTTGHSLLAAGTRARSV